MLLEAGRRQCGGAVGKIWWFSVSSSRGLLSNPSSPTHTHTRQQPWRTHGYWFMTEGEESPRSVTQSRLMPHTSLFTVIFSLMVPEANAHRLIIENIYWLSRGESSSFLFLCLQDMLCLYIETYADSVLISLDHCHVIKM